MGTVIILPELGQATAAWQDLVVGHRQKQVVDYEPLLEGAPEFEELSAQITALVRAAEQPVTLVGNGFGALVGLRVAASQSGRIDRLLLVAPNYHLTADLTVRALPSLFTPQTGQTAPTLLKRDHPGQVVNHRPVPGERDRQRPRPGGQGPRLTVSRQPLCSR
ncbi:hypothetical protein ACW2AB_00090 [Limosilactobacillus fermentum]